MLSEVKGNFKSFDPSITSSKPDFSDAIFESTINVASVDTDNEKRNEHLKSADLFDIAKYPRLPLKVHL